MPVAPPSTPSPSPTAGHHEPVNDAAKAVLALTNSLIDAGPRPLKAAEVWPLLEAVGDPSTLLGRSATDLATVLPDGVDAERVALTLLGSGLALAAQLSALDDRGIWTLTPFDPDFPAALFDRLGHGTPPVLYGAGEPALLAADAVGVVGSRDPSAASTEVARTVALAAVEHDVAGDLGRIAGHRPGRVRRGGRGRWRRLVAVLAESLVASVGAAPPAGPSSPGRPACARRPTRPGLRRCPARGRNRIIYGLSAITLVVAVERDADTTWSGATESRKRHGPVAVWRGDGGGPDNEALEQAGAVPITDAAALVDGSEESADFFAG